ncbi:metal ABC transporter ATP-binding protein [Nakamurella flavida]|uniref:Metal ABC transporter ATP-binding protein n=1 Tax=Nakamurella flavida TaxID=363630 RepID=A0A939C6E6_9ACTN|nr:metal ABC transporter ATP-binding protein [Nakamurella flavida]MBM9477974.1 metal ABC transporter ATP-binding protein [Nakamurella flavida]MDP9778310.1 zinc/manganese transport system ATP-binding protein [Nakamurella flavida]
MADPQAPEDRQALRLRGACLSYGSHALWHDLDLDVPQGQFVAVLGSNGSGKTSLLRVLLGTQPLTAGRAWVMGRPVSRGDTRVGYVPQRVAIDSATMVKARDVVRMGLDGHRWGMPVAFGARRRADAARIDALMASVGASAFAQAPVSMLSGGELQRVRVAEALASDPALLLCDEPLAALDMRHQREVAALIDEQRRRTNTAVLFVTHDVNAVLPYVDQVLYLAGGRFRAGPPDEVLTSEALTELYQAPVEVFRTQGRVIVVPSTELHAVHHQSHDDHAATEVDQRVVAGGRRRRT